MSEVWRAARVHGTLPRMRRLSSGAAALFVLASAAVPAHAQSKTTISGTVVHGKSGKPVAKAKVRVIGARVDGQGRVFDETATSNRNGSYALNVPERKGLEFAVEVTYDDGLFVGDSVRIRKGTEKNVHVEVWNTTSDPSAIQITDDQLVVAQDESNTGVLEVVTVDNPTKLAYIGRGQSMGAEQDQDSPTLGFSLPSQAIGQPIELIDSSLNRLYAVDASFGFAATVAIPPGETTATFRYLIPGEGGRFDLTRRALYPTDAVTVLATDPLEIDSDRLDYQGREEIGPDEYRKWTSTNSFDAGDLIPVLAVAEGSGSSSLWIGILIGLGIIVLLVGIGIVARRRSASVPRSRSKPTRTKLPPKEDLVSAIAELDLRHESGEMTEREWSEERTRLKSLLIGARGEESAP